MIAPDSFHRASKRFPSPSGTFPNFFTSKWISSPGLSRSYRTTNLVVRSRRASTERPARLSTPYTVEACMPSSLAMRCGPASTS